MGEKSTGYSRNGYKLHEQTMANWKISTSKMLCVALHQCCTNRENTGIQHSVRNKAGKLTQKFVLVLHKAATYCHLTVYCSEISVMLN